MRSYNTATTKLFSADQVQGATVTYWDTPFSPLVGGVASAGITMTVKEPTAAGAFTCKAAITGGAASGVAAAWGSATATTVVTGGRTPNVLGYWAGGAPGYHGASVNRRVAYRFECFLRSTTGRGWWSTAATPAFWLAMAGSGYMRVVKTVSGVASDVFDGALSEQAYLSSGFSVSSAITTMATSDKLDIYYVQDNDDWGGLVVKAVLGAIPSTEPLQRVAARAAPVLGCALMDTGTAPTAQTLDLFDSIDVSRQVGSTARATLRAPLINPANTDDIGWQWYYPTSTSPGQLRLNTTAGTNIDISRQRLIQISGGLSGESYVLFTGFVDDFRAEGSSVEISCLGLDQRLADQFQKNYPDKISYMSYGYRGTSGTSEPVYDIQAYDNWPMEYALRDLLVRAGIDDYRTRIPLTVPQAAGTYAAVIV